ncbi:MAG TPA: toxin HicA [Spirochaetota bacterium]|nr:toxin HicA [Spirochaetota bacterium]HPS86389.1 toxin HicA [Spirochaetota bacterium]
MHRFILNCITEVRFQDLLKICEDTFGIPIIIGSHYIFATPWNDDPLVSIQKDGIFAKPYQVKIVKEALEKLEAMNEKH